MSAGFFVAQTLSLQLNFKALGFVSKARQARAAMGKS
jgi:hypothetical protein